MKVQWLWLVLCCVSAQIFSQDLKLTEKDSVVSSSWKFGLGLSIIDDSSAPGISDLLNIKETWNVVPFPNRISLGRLFKNGIGFELSGTYNRYKTGKIVDGLINMEPRNYYAVDALLNYDLNRVIGDTKWFDPYVQAGAGYSDIGSIGRSTFDAGFGFNMWTGKNLGINLNTMGKWGLPKGSTKQIQHSIGVVYQVGAGRVLSKKGLEKKLLLEALEKETQRIQDSISAVKLTAANAQLLAEKLQKEQEEAKRVAELEKVRNVENARKSGIERELNAIGSVYFDLNSSYLNTVSKRQLDQIAQLLQKNGTLVLKVSSHTDSRGEDGYNQWLSERRVRRTLNYLLAKGITEERLHGSGLGEKELTNECDNVTPCPEEKHSKNRRSEFAIIGY